MKYIVLSRQVSSGGVQELPVIFPNELVHADVAGRLQRLLGMGGQVVAAGFVHFDSAPRCAGLSESLDIKSRGNTDSALIFDHDENHGLLDGTQKAPADRG